MNLTPPAPPARRPFDTPRRRRLLRPVRPPALLLAGFGVFVALLGYVLVSSLSRRQVPTFPPREAGPDTLTVDARDSKQWRFIDLDRGRSLTAPDTAGWDLAIRRFHLIVSEAVAEAGAGGYDHLTSPPASGYVSNAPGADTTNAAFHRWYSYSMLSHLLVPKGRLFVVRTREARFAKLELISYYCPGLQAGCLTFRYRFLD